MGSLSGLGRVCEEVSLFDLSCLREVRLRGQGAGNGRKVI